MNLTEEIVYIEPHVFALGNGQVMLLHQLVAVVNRLATNHDRLINIKPIYTHSVDVPISVRNYR